MSDFDDMAAGLARIYGADRGAEAAQRLMSLLKTFTERRPGAPGGPIFSEADTVVITYGDSLRTPGEAPLTTLRRFAAAHLKGAFSAVHILPFYPFSSDDGFSVIDFNRVDPNLGTWDDVAALGREFRLMFDFVLNHISAQSPWFRAYLAETAGFEKLAIAVDPATDLSMVVRPRALPLLTEFRKDSGETVHVWTTFSADQIDLNYASLDVMEQMVRVLLHYLERGASLLRLDAVAYLWKRIGTPCIHLPETHEMVKLLRKILDLVAPDVMLITETNVPHHENIRYFGNGRDEAQMVYNFTLPPLLLHTFLTRNASELTRWASELRVPSDTTTFFNFTASHDGIGVRPLEGILPPEAVSELGARVIENGGHISYKRNPDGSESPYELNITYVDALLDGHAPGGDPLHAERFLASQAIPLTLPGVPGIYIHSILGSRNWSEGVQETGRARSINREKPGAPQVAAEIADPSSLRHRIYHPYTRLLGIRRRQPAFHPNAECTVHAISPSVFALVRRCPAQEILAMTNVTPDVVEVPLAVGAGSESWSDVLSGSVWSGRGGRLAPYQSVWLERQPR